MKTLVLNTIGKDVSEQIKAQINDKEAEIIDTSDMKIAHCMGCNQCWLKTPGICAIKDDYEEILKKLVETENLWIVSDTRFGFLDYKGKRVMDRIVPMLNMTVGFRDGWMRHEMRYHSLNIGLLYKGDADQTMMEDWCKRTAANTGGQSLGAIELASPPAPLPKRGEYIVVQQKTPTAKVTTPLSLGEGLGVRPHLVIILGTYMSTTFENEDQSILFLGTDNTQYWPQPKDGKNPSIGAFRAYFKIGEDGAQSSARMLTAFNIDFGDGEAQGITTTDYTDYTDKAGAWYDLQGRRINGQWSTVNGQRSMVNGQRSMVNGQWKKGIYIHNGRKVVIK